MAEGKLFPDLILSVLNIGAGGVNELLLIGVFGLRAVQPWQALTGPGWAVLLPGLAAPDVLHSGSCRMGEGLHKSHSVVGLVPLITSALFLAVLH